MATVKGDVHDIGKNIVGVVLQCNNFEVIDIGVMVPTADILAAAKEHNVDVIGLSGLITPSLEEMTHIAKEMKRLGMNIPVMIGGATTSKAHTAVKISPECDHPIVWVKDASRAVGVAQSLISPELRDKFIADLHADYDAVRERHYSRQKETKWLSLEAARANKTQIDWKTYEATKPSFTGTKVFEDYSLAEITPYIDWTPFFHSWELKGSYPKIFDDADKGEEAKKLFADAQKMLKQIINENWLQAKAVIGLYPANSTGDDIEVYADDTRNEVLTTLHNLRQQQEKPTGKPNRCLSDFVAPKGQNDYVGSFAVTTGIGIDERVAAFEKDHDDYSAIMLKALADRLAEAFAELIHLRVREEFWGYDADCGAHGNGCGCNIPNVAKPSQEAVNKLTREEYRGIRPAAGYPACPDHTEKDLIWELMQVKENTGIWLTEAKAMVPTAAVSGIYYGHPDASYFAVGKINKDQVKDYAQRKGMSIEDAEYWLAPNKGY
ncbi:vitamin B12 dependent-methionine synthase activation domain-containing protein, partial [Pseudomonadota bacterium]